MTDLEIRRGIDSDAQAIAEFNRRLARESEGKTLDEAVVLAGVRRQLADQSLGRYLVALRAGEIVGQLGVTTEWSDWRNGRIWWIQSVYVRADCRGQGVYRALHARLEELAGSEPDVIGLRLYIEQNNERARRTYEGVGLTEAGYRVMEKLWLEKTRGVASSG